jgi:hypothetical protein
MVEQLADMLPDFSGASTHTRCFLHTTNLVAKALMKEFDAKPKKRGEDGAAAAMDDDEDLSADEARLVKELEELSEGIELEDLVTTMGQGLTDDERNVDVDGLIDEIELLSDKERQELLKSIRPIKLALTKVGSGNGLRTLSSTDFWHVDRSANSHSSSSILLLSCCQPGRRPFER